MAKVQYTTEDLLRDIKAAAQTSVRPPGWATCAEIGEAIGRKGVRTREMLRESGCQRRPWGRGYIYCLPEFLAWLKEKE